MQTIRPIRTFLHLCERLCVNYLKLGVIAGILIAPAKGSQTRQKVTRAVGDLSDYIQDNIVNCESDKEEAMNSELEYFEKELS